MLASTCAALALVLVAAPAARAGRRDEPVAGTTHRTGHAPGIVGDARGAGGAPGRVARAAARSGPAEHKAAATARAAQGALERARAVLAEVKRDPVKRRYRDRWERAIAALERAARGKDTAAALLDAARARYALYRFSQVDADRTAALALARRAQRAGSRDAAAFAAAVRREMGEEERPQVARVADRNAGRERAARQRAAAPAAIEKGVATGSPRAAPTTAPSVPRSGASPTAPTPAPPTASTDTAAAPGAGDDDEAATDPILDQAVAGDAAPVAATAPEAAGPARVSEVKSWSNGDYTRIAVYLSRHVGFTREEIPADGEHPRRLALDLKPALLGRGLAWTVGDALVERVRAAQYDPQTVRVVLDLAGRDDLSIFALDDPPRLIVDVGVREAERQAQADAQARAQQPTTADGATPGPVAATPAPSAEAAAPKAPAAAAPAPSPGGGQASTSATTSPSPVASPGPRTAPREEEGDVAHRPIRRVIVDAGHGGHDTGAIGPSGVREKDVTLAMARRLARRLRERGFEVVLTRGDDTFVPLEERTAIANARHGDLFVSLHANAHPRRDRKGVETYVLNVADNRYAARLAARENGALTDSEDGPQVGRILSDLEAKSSAVASRRLASAVQREVCAGIRGRFGEARDLGVKSALFYVLLGARMPAVLVETSFISNRAEERRLGSPRFQDAVAQAVARAVEGFASREARIAAR